MPRSATGEGSSTSGIPARAAANLLFGYAVPGGKLPFNWPRNVGQVPLIYSRLPSHEPANSDKRYWNEPNPPTYVFGHGLSYTTFAYSNLRFDQPLIVSGGTVTVSVDLQNTGGPAADEVAQLYIHQRQGTAARRVRDLKGFRRVTLKPREKQTMRFTPGSDELRYWNAAERDWVLDPDTFEVWVGGSSQVELAGTFRVRET